MNMVPDGLGVIGPDCSSWGIMARSVSGRNYINPEGFTNSKWVSDNNSLVSRSLGRILESVELHTQVHGLLALCNISNADVLCEDGAAYSRASQQALYICA